MTKKFEAEQLKSKKQEKELAAVKKQLEMKMSEAVRLSADVFKLKKCLADLRRGGGQKQVAQPAVAAANGNHQAAASAALVAISHKTRERPAANISSGNAVAQVTQAQASSHVANPSAQVQRPRGAVLSAAPALSLAGRDIDELTAAIGKYKPVFDVPLLGARVFGIAPSCRFVCVGEMFAENLYGLVMLNANDGRGRTRVAVHNSEVRDLCFWELESHVLTVAFDGKLAVTSLGDQKVVMQVELPPGRRQGWSCCFSETDPNAMFCGFHDGSVAQYDMRKPASGEQGVVKNFSLPESQPVHSLKIFKSRDSIESLAAATTRGLSIWKDVGQVTNNGNHPVVGSSSTGAMPFCHSRTGQACYSLASNQLFSSQMVVSTRSSPIMHSLFNLRTLESGQLRRTTVFAGHQAPSVLSRSALWSEPDGTSILASWSHDLKRITLCDVASRQEARGPEPTAMSVASSSMPVVDIHHAVANGTWNSGNALFGTMTSRQLCLYRRTL